MLLTGYRKEIFRPECNPQFQSLHCIAHLDEDITEVLPYLNTVLGGHQYFREPPALTFKHHGKLITLHPREIAINALKDEEEADRILEWLKGEINTTWEKRGEIRPSFETPAGATLRAEFGDEGDMATALMTDQPCSALQTELHPVRIRGATIRAFHGVSQ